MSRSSTGSLARNAIKTACPKWFLRRHASAKPQPPHNEAKYENEIKTKILDASLAFVPQVGWSKEALTRGAEKVGYPGITHGMFLRGAGDLVDHFQVKSNKNLVVFLQQLQVTSKTKPLEAVKIVELGVQERLRMTEPYLANWPQALAIMSLPANVPKSLAALLTMVDDICYYAGDRSVNFNWYARRIAVAGVYKTTELYYVQDGSENKEKTWKFLSNRLTELSQMQDLLKSVDVGSQGTVDTVTGVFATARNILGLNWNR